MKSNNPKSGKVFSTTPNSASMNLEKSNTPPPTNNNNNIIDAEASEDLFSLYYDEDTQAFTSPNLEMESNPTPLAQTSDNTPNNIKINPEKEKKKKKEEKKRKEKEKRQPRNKNKKNTQPPRLMTKIITVHSAKQETMTAHHRLHQLHRSGPTKVLQTNHFESTVIMSTV